jgi:hypothetical protein
MEHDVRAIIPQSCSMAVEIERKESGRGFFFFDELNSLGLKLGAYLLPRRLRQERTYACDEHERTF